MWFLYTSIILFNAAAFLMKKHLRGIEYYASIFWGLFFSNLADRFTDKYNMYGFFGSYFVDLKTLLIIFGIYPAATMLIINWFPFNRSIAKKIMYILFWSLFSILFEWLSIKAGFLYHHKWNLWLSAATYPIIYFLLIANVKFIHWLEKRN